MQAYDQRGCRRPSQEQAAPYRGWGRGPCPKCGQVLIGGFRAWWRHRKVCPRKQ